MISFFSQIVGKLTLYTDKDHEMFQFISYEMTINSRLICYFLHHQSSSHSEYIEKHVIVFLDDMYASSTAYTAVIIGYDFSWQLLWHYIITVMSRRH